MKIPSHITSTSSGRSCGAALSSTHVQRTRPVHARFTTSTVDVHASADLLQDPLWFGPRPKTKASVPLESPVRATRTDVRLIACFNNQVETTKLQMEDLVCTDPVLARGLALLSLGGELDSAAVMDEDPTRASMDDWVCSVDEEALVQKSSVASYLKKNLRVGETLPHWFVDGKFGVAAKVWLAQRSCSRSTTSGIWDPALSEHLLGWDLDEAATEEDVQTIADFGTVLRQSHMDTLTLLEKDFGVDPFSWCNAQISAGVIPEPEPYMMERFFLSRHKAANPLPLWYAQWGIRARLPAWLEEQRLQQQLQQQLREKRAAMRRSQDSMDMASGSSLSVDADHTTLSDEVQHMRSVFLSTCTSAGLLNPVREKSHSGGPASAYTHSRQTPSMQVCLRSLHNPLDSTNHLPHIMMTTTSARSSAGDHMHAANSSSSSSSDVAPHTSTVMLVHFLPADEVSAVSMAQGLVAKEQLDFHAYLAQQQQNLHLLSSVSPASSTAAGKGDVTAQAESSADMRVLRVLCCEVDPAPALVHYMQHSGVVVLQPGEWQDSSNGSSLVERITSAMY